MAIHSPPEYYVNGTKHSADDLAQRLLIVVLGEDALVIPYARIAERMYERRLVSCHSLPFIDNRVVHFLPPGICPHRSNRPDLSVARNDREIDGSDLTVFLTSSLEAVVVDFPVRYRIHIRITFNRAFNAVEDCSEFNVRGPPLSIDVITNYALFTIKRQPRRFERAAP